MGIFGWLKPEEEPENGGLVEVSRDDGTHIVISTPSHDDALDVEGQLRRDAGAKSEPKPKGRDASTDWDSRDHDQTWVRSAAVASSNEDLEPEEDNDEITEPDEQPAEGGWFNWF